MATHDHVLSKAAATVDWRVGLRDGIPRLLHRREILHLVGHAAVLDLTIGGLNEAVFVHPCISGERIDQPDVRTFRRLNGTNTPVVRGMHVAHFKTGAFARQTSGAKRGEPSLV